MDYPRGGGMCVMNMSFGDNVNVTGNGTDFGNASHCKFPFIFGPPPMDTSVLIMSAIMRWSVPVLVSVGVVLNVLNIYIFKSTKFKNTSSSRYLMAIAVVDIAYLVTKFVVDLDLYYKVPLTSLHGVCQVVMYINFMSIFLSYWYVTILVVEKFIGLHWPDRKSTYCTIFRAKCVIICFLVMAIVFYHYITWTVAYDNIFKMCMPYNNWQLYNAYNRMNTMDFILVNVLPFIVIIALCIGICAKTWKFYKMSHRSGRRAIYNCQSTCQQKEFKTTPIVISVAVFTILSGAAFSVTRIFKLKLPFLIILATLLQLVSMSFKFVIYVVVSSSFRRQLRHMARDVWRKVRCSNRNSDAQAPEMYRVKQQADTSEVITMAFCDDKQV